MQFETLKKNNLKKYLIGVSVFIVIILAIIFARSFAKYKAVDSAKLASGTVNYTLPDFQIVEMYSVVGETITSINEMPTETDYTLDSEKSFCYLKDRNTKEEGIILKTNDAGEHVIGKFQRGSKCVLYFNEKKYTAEDTLADLGLKDSGEAKNLKGTVCEGTCDIKDENGLYYADDDYGTSYYFRGSVSNNWVKFGQTKEENPKDLYWRIIRINGNGTIRLIYAGEEGSLGEKNTGKNAVDNAYNSSKEDNKFVGFMYGSVSTPTEKYEDAHKNEAKSDILNELETWWGTTNLDDLLGKIDGKTGFCNDRQSYDGSSSSSTPDISSKGYGKVYTYYGSYIRASQTRQPTFKCAQKKQDLFTLQGKAGDGNGALTKPVGLITVDEIMYAGGYYGKSNTGYWLNSGTYYWTMSPVMFDGGTAIVFSVSGSGYLHYDGVGRTAGVRPVINLRADIKFKTTDGLDGTYQHPYEVV